MKCDKCGKPFIGKGDAVWKKGQKICGKCNGEKTLSEEVLDELKANRACEQCGVEIARHPGERPLCLSCGKKLGYTEKDIFFPRLRKK